MVSRTIVAGCRGIVVELASLAAVARLRVPVVALLTGLDDLVPTHGWAVRIGVVVGTRRAATVTGCRLCDCG
ncbi:MAG: hypothetical protein JWN48_461, partial [Myxococcaceae bacterium]|nr:hypothetical protein [Myxococcaceae bacterium]